MQAFSKTNKKKGEKSMGMDTLKKPKFLKGYSAFEKRDFLFVYLLIAVPVIQFAVFWAYVNFSSFLLAFQTPQGKFTWQNFTDLFTTMREGDAEGFKFFVMLGRSLSLWSVSNLLAFPISLATTYVLYKRVTGHYVFRICYLLPSLVGSVVWAAMVKQLFEFNGPVIYILKNLGVNFSFKVLQQGLFSDASTAFPSLVIMTFMLGFVGGNAVLTGAYARISDELFEVGKLDGINFWREFFCVALPCVWPTIATLFTFSLCSIFMADGNVFVYTNGTGDPEMSTMGFYIYYKVYRISQSSDVNNLPYGYVSAVGMFLTAMTLPVVLIGRWLLEKISEPVEN